MAEGIINSNNSIFIIKNKKSPSFTVSANTNGYTTINIEEQGYTPLGILEIRGSNNSYLSYSDWYMESDKKTARIYFRLNKSSSQTTDYLQMRILYIRNDKLY